MLLMGEPARPPADRQCQAPLLATKLFVPRVRGSLVARPHLVSRLGDPLQRPLTLVCAPAGYGKTALVVEWLSHLDHPIAWPSLDDGDNDPVRFLRYLVAALQTIEPGVGRATMQLLTLPQLPPAEALVIPLASELVAIARPLVLVLDDYHVVHSRAIHEIIECLLAHQPPLPHLVLATRSQSGR
jgi:ATP/maltotriose-dependent transcriptional regulator MalT